MPFLSPTKAFGGVSTGNVGIGTGSYLPADKLNVLTNNNSYGFVHVNGDPTASSTVKLASKIADGEGWLGTKSDHPLYLFSNGKENPRLSINNSTGNVGIGTETDAAAYKLTVKTGSTDYGIIHTDGTIKVGTKIDGEAWIGTKSNNSLYFFTNDVTIPQMVLDKTNGWVGIGTGTNAPRVKLDVMGSNLNYTGVNENIFQLTSTTPTNPLAIQFGLKTHNTADYRLAIIDVNEGTTKKILC